MTKKEYAARIEALEAEVKRLNELVQTLAARPMFVVSAPAHPRAIAVPLPYVPPALPTFPPTPYGGPTWTGELGRPVPLPTIYCGTETHGNVS